jgi:hypothetical protein
MPAGFAGQRLQFELLVLSPIAVTVTLVAGYQAIGRPRRSEPAQTAQSAQSAP